jgi:hypothetical protein
VREYCSRIFFSGLIDFRNERGKGIRKLIAVYAAFANSASATEDLAHFTSKANQAVSALVQVMREGPKKDQDFRNMLADNVERIRESFREVMGKVPPDLSEYFEFMEYVGREKINYKTPPANTKIFINESNVSGVSLSGIQNLYFVGTWNPIGFSLPTSLITLGFFDNSTGLNATQRTAISNLVKNTKVLQNLIIMNWGNVEITAEAFCGTGTGTNYGSLVNVVIHNAISIASQAFRYCGRLKSVSIPDAVIVGVEGDTVSTGAFVYCSLLETVEFPKARSIGRYAFYGCSLLQAALFPVATGIGDYAFYACNSLKAAFFPKTTSIGGWAFKHSSALETASFPAAITIGEGGLEGTALQVVSFPDATSISNSAFWNCSALQAVSFPKAISIGGYAFCGCSSLRVITYPKGIFVGGSAFSGCPNNMIKLNPDGTIH